MDRQALLLHQVHPAKLAVDAAAGVGSDVLLWRGRLREGLLLRYAVPVLGSVAVLRFGRVSDLSGRQRGVYVLNLPPAAHLARIAGDAIMGVGAWRRRPALLVAGALVVAFGWSWGTMLPMAGDRPEPAPPQPPAVGGL